MNERNFGQVKLSLGAVDERVNQLVETLRSAGLPVEAYEAWRDSCLASREPLKAQLDAGGVVLVGDEVVEAVEAAFDAVGGLEYHLKLVDGFRRQVEEAERRHEEAGVGLAAQSLKVADGVESSSVLDLYVEYALNPEESRDRSGRKLARARQFLAAGNVAEGNQALADGRQFATRQHFLTRLVEQGKLVPVSN